MKTKTSLKLAALTLAVAGTFAGGVHAGQITPSVPIGSGELWLSPTDPDDPDNTSYLFIDTLVYAPEVLKVYFPTILEGSSQAYSDKDQSFSDMTLRDTSSVTNTLLESGKSLKLEGGSYLNKSTGTSVWSGDMTVENGTYTNEGTQTVGGNFTQTGGTATNTGSLTVTGNMTLTGGTFTGGNESSLKVGGTLDTGIDLSLKNVDLGGLKVASGVTVGIANEEAVKLGNVSLAGTLNVGQAEAGSVDVNGGALTSKDLAATGAYSQTAGSSAIDGKLTAAALDVQAGSFSVKGIDIAGDASFASGVTLANDGDVTVGGKLSSQTVLDVKALTAGSLEVNGSQLTADSAVVTGEVKTTGTNALLEVAGALKAGSLSHTSGTLVADGLDVDGDALIGAIYTNADMSEAKDIRVGGKLTINGTQDVVIGGATTQTGIHVTGNKITAGSIDVAQDNALHANGDVNVGGASNIAGVMYLSGSQSTFDRLTVSGSVLGASSAGSLGFKANELTMAGGDLETDVLRVGKLDLQSGFVLALDGKVTEAKFDGGRLMVRPDGKFAADKVGTINSVVELCAGSSVAIGTELREAAEGRTALSLGQGIVVGENGVLKIGDVEAAAPVARTFALRAARTSGAVVQIGADVDVYADLDTFSADTLITAAGSGATMTVASGSTMTVSGGSWGTYQLAAGFATQDLDSWVENFTDLEDGRHIEWTQNADGSYGMVIGSNNVTDMGFKPAGLTIVNAALVAADRSVDSDHGDVALINRALNDSYLAADLRAKTLDSAMQIGAATGSLAASAQTVRMATDAVVGRFAQKSEEGVHLWVNPLGGWISADTEAKGIDGGYDFDAYGLMGGVENTFANGARIGAAAAYLSGSANSTGDYVKADADTTAYGLYGYVGGTVGVVDLSAHVGWMSMGHDATMTPAATMGGNLKADMDLSAVTFGVQAKTTFKMAAADLTPHLGLRYSAIDRDAFETKFDGKKAFETKSTKANILEVPVGVTVSKSFETASGTTVTPSADFTVTMRGGDKDVDYTVQAASLVASDKMSESVVGGYTAGFTFGVQAQGKNFTVGAGAGASFGADGEKAVQLSAKMTYCF